MHSLITLALLWCIYLRRAIIVITLGRVIQRSIVITEVVVIVQAIGIVDLINSIISITLPIINIRGSITIAVDLVKVDMQGVAIEPG